MCKKKKVEPVQCSYCHKKIVEEKDQGYEDTDGTPMCYECHSDEFLLICPICDDHYNKALKAEDYVFVITAGLVKELSSSMKPGFYQALDYPVTHNSILGDDLGFFTENIQLIQEMDIVAVLNRIEKMEASVFKQPPRYIDEEDGIISGQCCHDCFNKWTGKVLYERTYWEPTPAKDKLTRYIQLVIKQINKK